MSKSVSETGSVKRKPWILCSENLCLWNIPDSKNASMPTHTLRQSACVHVTWSLVNALLGTLGCAACEFLNCVHTNNFIVVKNETKRWMKFWGALQYAPPWKKRYLYLPHPVCGGRKRKVKCAVIGWNPKYKLIILHILINRVFRNKAYV